MTKFQQGEQQLLLPGPSGQLEAMTTLPEDKLTGVAIVCHPHPLHGGTMNNKVVTIITKTLAEAGFATVRFNYRGVGKSDGHYGKIKGEVADLLAVKKWAQTELPSQQLWLAGFSFGAFIAATVANQSNDIAQLISVAPAVNHADFASLTAINCPWLVVQGEEDEVVSFAEVQAFATESAVPLDFVAMPATSHFFHGKILNLKKIIEERLNLV